MSETTRILFEDKHTDIDYTQFKSPDDLEAFIISGGHRTRITKKYPVVVTPQGRTIDLRGQDINSKFKITITNLTSLASAGAGLLHCLSNLIR
jgi:hypothetical protein